LASHEEILGAKMKSAVGLNVMKSNIPPLTNGSVGCGSIDFDIELF
jgi:hypothetical protein